MTNSLPNETKYKCNAVSCAPLFVFEFPASVSYEFSVPLSCRTLCEGKFTVCCRTPGHCEMAGHGTVSWNSNKAEELKHRQRLTSHTSNEMVSLSSCHQPKETINESDVMGSYYLSLTPKIS